MPQASSMPISLADLVDARLIGANLIGANLQGAKLRGAKLIGVNFTGANLTGADLSDSSVGWTTFANNDLSSVKGLESLIHRGPSSLDIPTLYKSGYRIPTSFLSGCGIPDSFIEFVRSLANNAIDFYSCFISYSSKDQDFAERLYADLQNKGVRCWFAPEDLKIGDKFRQRIDESIRLHDKLLLILSEHSITSPWVEEEVEAALERERRENRLVLFPIRMDDAVMDSGRAWAASLRRMRHIGDFSGWKDHDSYSKAFERLLRDLKDEGKVG